MIFESENGRSAALLHRHQKHADRNLLHLKSTTAQLGISAKMCEPGNDRAAARYQSDGGEKWMTFSLSAS